MALLQAILTLITRSAGKIVGAIFGWAVIALFGRTSQREKTMLSLLVAAAVAWPLLLLGIVFPRVGTMLVALVPLSHEAPLWIVRIVWAVASFAVPLLVGLVVASRAPPGSPREPFVMRALRGFPITIAISAAFVMVFAIVPLLRVRSALRRRTDEQIPLVTDSAAYEATARDIDALLASHEIAARRHPAPWWLSAPSSVLLHLGGRSLRGFVPRTMAYWRDDGLEIALYPSSALVRGPEKQTAWVHGVLAEALARGPALQTLDPAAQDLEKQIQQVWRVLDSYPRKHVESRVLESRVRDIAEELAQLRVPYDEWQIVYRELGQLARALDGQPQLLERTPEPDMKENDKEAAMVERPNPQAQIERPLGDRPAGELVGDLVTHVSQLVTKEVHLAKVELEENLESEKKMVAGLTVAAMCASTGMSMILLAVILALSQLMAGWAAALLVGAVMLAIGTVTGLAGWAKRVRKPLEKTQRTVKEDARWAKERIA